jgi:dTDP-4-amino-4,6-dideoxygalactose transaminase
VKYHNEIKGVNSRLDEIQAAVLRAKLPDLDRATNERREIAARYLHEFQGLPLLLPYVPDWAEPAWHLFVVRHKNRDQFQASLAECGIGTLVHYPVSPHRQPAYAELGFGADDYQITNSAHSEVLSLPLWPGMDDEAILRVIRDVKACA